MGLPRALRPACGSSYTFSQYTLPRLEKHSTRVVRVRHKQLLDEILILHGGRRLAAAAAALGLILGDRLRLGVAGMRERDHHILRLDQILGREIEMIAIDLGAARIAIGLADLDELVAHHLRSAARDAREYP